MAAPRHCGVMRSALSSPYGEVQETSAGGGKVCDSGMDVLCTGGNKYLDMVCGYRV